MLHKMYSRRTMRIPRHGEGTFARRFFGKSSKRDSTELLLGRGNVGNANKWNKLSHKGKPLCMAQQRYFAEYQSISAITKGLLDTYPCIVQEFTDDPRYNDVPEAVSCFKDTLERVIPPAKDNLTISFAHCYLSMEDPKKMTPEKLKIIHIISWCFQMLQASAIIFDDMVDDCDLRLGKKCWHTEDDVGLRAVVDNMLVDVQLFRLLKKYCSHLPTYVPIVRLWYNTFLKVALGFYLDAMVLHKNGLTLDHYTRQRHQTLTEHKLAIPAFHLPYAISGCLCDNYYTKPLPEITKMLTRIAYFFQIQNDFRDCYDVEFDSNKSTTDIAQGRGTWLITRALELVNPEQRQLLETHYGKKNDESVNIVKDLYTRLGIPRIYVQVEDEVFDFVEKNYEKVSKLTCLPLTTKRIKHVYDKLL